MLKYAAKVVADPLTKRFNMSIRTGQCLEDWKKGEWSPVYKKRRPFGCKELPPNHNARYSGQGVF